MAFYTFKIRFRNSNLPPFNCTDWGQAPVLGRARVSKSEQYYRPSCSSNCFSGLAGLQSPNLLHKHAEVAKNWALSWTDAGHRHAPESSDDCSDSLECKKAGTGRGPARKGNLAPWSKFELKCFKCSVETFATREWSEATQISLFRNNSEITAK